MEETISVLGYHKNRKERASKICGFKNFPISRGKRMWLGDGIYFWDTIDNAKWWNSKVYPDGVILSAQLKCSSKHYVDLDIPANMKSMVGFAESLKCEIEKVGECDIDFSDQLQARAFFCTCFKKENGILLMRHSFPYTDKEWNVAGFREMHSRTQYCATNNSIISNIKYLSEATFDNFLVESGDINEYI